MMPTPRALRARPTLSILALLLSHAAWLTPASAQGPLDLEPEDLRPGLHAHYRSLVQPEAVFERLDAKPAFALGQASPHPRLPDGPFEVVWTGLIQVRESAPIAFHAFVAGSVTVEVDGIAVLKGEGRNERAAIGPAEILKRPPGIYRFLVRYRALAGVPARLQLFWESETFAREPLPAWRLSHRAADLPESFERERQREAGRTSAQRLGCARCHTGAFPGIEPTLPGPSLAEPHSRLESDWLVRWLEEPARVRDGARMPALFADDRRGFVQRWIVADHLAGATEPNGTPVQGDHRLGRRGFLGMGCAACHLVPDIEPAEQGGDSERIRFAGLRDRLREEDLAAILVDPHARYPDGRMPRFPVAPKEARDIASYLLLWSPRSAPKPPLQPPADAEIDVEVRRLGAQGRAAAATVLIAEKGCAACHAGLGQPLTRSIPIARATGHGCLTAEGVPRFALDDRTRAALESYMAVASREHAPSPVVRRREALERAGCVRCHQRDSDRPPPIEVAGSTLGGGHLSALPFQRTPRLNDPHRRFTASYLLKAVREGVSGLRPTGYTYKMPAFGDHAEALVQALAEQDGELLDASEPPAPAIDPTLGSLHGPSLVGSQGYGCVSCHVWNGAQLAQPDPGAVGPDLTRVPGRIRRDWFDRFLEAPGRLAPGTPMPTIFPHGQPALITSVLDGAPGRQREAIWSYLLQGKTAPPPKAPAPVPVEAPHPGEPPLVAQIPIRLPDRAVVESLCVLNEHRDLLIYDLGTNAPRALFTGADILRNVQGRTRQFLAAGTSARLEVASDPALHLMGQAGSEAAAREFHGYDRLPDGVRLRWEARFAASTVSVRETLRLERGQRSDRLARTLELSGVPKGKAVAFPLGNDVAVTAVSGTAAMEGEGARSVMLRPDVSGKVEALFAYPIPAPKAAVPWTEKRLVDAGPVEGALERPGYRATMYARPKTIAGEDRVMPGALAVDPTDGRVFVASLKSGELFVLRGAKDAKTARFENYARGLFQDALGMLAEKDALYVLHRRNLTRVVDTDGDGLADRFDRLAALPHGVADTYDYAYGLVRDRQGDFLVSYAPYANTQLAGSGGAVVLRPGHTPQPIAYGFRNPIGWCAGPEREVFFTDNQGEWVAANKLCHLVPGRFYGFPNRAQSEHVKRPVGKAAVWVPYGWARSINGVTYDTTNGAFGPFAGQFFLAELMFGGAIIRADLERVNGEYQGACFPFWGKGLLGPVSLAFDPRGPLYVGAITEPGWMAQPDRGALFRIDFTGMVPFEMQTIRVTPRGFRIRFTAPADRGSAASAGAYRVEHYRYEYTGAYGSPELDRSRDEVLQARVAEDGRSVELMLAGLRKEHIYLISAAGVRSAQGESLVNPTGAYTLNEIPSVRP